MGYRVKGALKLPDGSPASNAEIEFISRKNFSPLVRELKSNILCGPTGAYDVTLEFGEYAVMVYPGGTYPAALGTIILAVDTVVGQDLPTLLQQAGWHPATPEYIQQIAQWLAEANASATKSTASASAAKVSETNSKASEIAAEADRSEVAVNTADVRVKHSDVVAKSAQVSIDSSATQAAKSTAVSAADTATQKALAAAESEASAFSSATRAEQAAQTMTGALIDAGPYSASGGILPSPSMSSGVKRSSIWKVTGGGTAGGIELGVGDSLVYTASDSSYYKIDNTESVSSVNGKKGVVVISSIDVGADASGTAQNLVNQHAAKSEAHPISGVVGLQSALDSKYSANNKPAIVDITGLRAELDGANAKIAELELWPRSGSNANGSWVKHRDGTMICTFSGVFNVAISSGYSPLFHGSLTLTFPVEFIRSPEATIGSARWGSGASWGTLAGFPTTTAVSIRILDVSKRDAGPTEVSYTAIGRWK